MRLIVIVVTANRKATLGGAILHLDAQTRAPDLLVVSAPDKTHVDLSVRPGFPVEFVFGASGCAAQRNRALDLEAVRAADVIAFFDDDFLPAEDYLALAEEAFRRRPDWAVLTGHVLADGVNGAGLSLDEGRRILACSDRRAASGHDDITTAGAYGCNMAYRVAGIGDRRFDERLPLYGWQEDTDFSRRVANGRPVVRLHGMRGVHLGVKNGRVSGVRFGYSQIANPVHLVRKGVGTTGWAANLIARNVLANLARSVRPEAHVDRLGRLRGNMIAVGHALRGRLDPEFVTRL